MATQAPNSYKDPFWSDLASRTEQKLELPSGLLRSIILNGEKSNADQVSEANAKTPFQIIPGTRDAVLKKYGIDAYLSPENAAEAAGLLLKESLQRNKGDISLAAAEYHGGTNQANWGPKTKAYVQRVTAGMGQDSMPSSMQQGSTAQQTGSGGQSTFQRALSLQQSQAKPETSAIQNIYNAYSQGLMTEQEAADFESDVKSGKLMLPRGASLMGNQASATKSGLPDIDPGVIEAYNSGKMTRDEMIELESHVKNGFYKPNPALQLKQTQPLGMLGKIKEAFTGEERATDLTRSLPDWAGMPELNSMSMASFKTALGTMATSPEETVKIIKANAPNVQVSQDEKGNYILKSSIDGQMYAIKPGAQWSDLPRFLGVGAAFTPAGAARSLAGMAAGAGATQAAIEGTQAATGGEINPGDIAASALLAPAIPLAVQGVKAVGAPIQNLAARAMGRSAPEIPAIAPIAAQETASAAGSVRPVATVEAQALTPAQQVVRDADQAGIRVMTSDVRPPDTFMGRGAQRISESIPVAGTGGQRAAQQTERVAAVRNLLDEYGAGDAAKASENVMADLAKKRGDDLTKYATLKNEVIDRLDKVGAVPVNRAVNVVDQEIKRLQALKTENMAPVIGKLEDFKQSIQGQGLRNVDELRKQLGESFKSPDLVSVRSAAEKATGKIYGALREDMADFIKANGDRRDLTKWAVANNKLSQMIGELDMGALKSTLARGDATPEVVNNMLFSKKPSELNALYRNLTPNGRANARAAILSKAADDAATIGPAGETVISPDRFLNNYRKLEPSFKAFFSAEDAQKIEGLSRVLAATKRAGEFSASPPTGVQAVPFVAGSFLTDALGGFGAATASAATVGLLARALESAAVRNMLIQLPRTAKGSTQEASLIKRVIAAANEVPKNMGNKARVAAQSLPAAQTLTGSQQFDSEKKQ